jgi:hypothetical protein
MAVWSINRNRKRDLNVQVFTLFHNAVCETKKEPPKLSGSKLEAFVHSPCIRP